MVKMITYLLESSALLALFYLFYVLMLRKETFFSLNRFFLLGTTVFSLFLPIISFDIDPTSLLPIDRPVEKISKYRLSYYEAIALLEYEGHKAGSLGEKRKPESNSMVSKVDGWANTIFTVILVIYIMGIVVSMSRMLWAIRWIYKMISIYPQEIIEGVKVIKLPQPGTPFSFLKYVFVHHDLVKSPDFDQIMAHEKVHIQEGHSIDLIFVQLIAAFFWFNPVIWRLIKSLKTIHEYIADKKIMNSGYSLLEYQTLLLRQLISNNSLGLVHNFNLSFIKKRITMMNHKKSGWAGKAKVALALSAFVGLSLVIVQCNSKTDEQILLESPTASTPEASSEVNFPLLPEVGQKFNMDSKNTLNLTISGNKVSINGEKVNPDELASVLEHASDQETVVVSRIDGAQSMALVREVQLAFRKADLLKFLYLGQTSGGEQVEIPLLLPPFPTNEIVSVDEKYAAENDMDLLKIQMGEYSGTAVQQKVYDFVKDQMVEQKSNYVVSARFNDQDSFQDYLISLYHLKEAFYQIYDERAQDMYGKNYQEIFKKRKEGYAEVYEAVTKGIPMAISIAG